jgi:hypothetical protein
MRDTRTVTDHDGENEAERKGQERADAAHDRLEHARERARIARQEAESAPSAEAAEVHREEAQYHDKAAAVHCTAEKLQRHHIEEAREAEDDAVALDDDVGDGGRA